MKRRLSATASEATGVGEGAAAAYNRRPRESGNLLKEPWRLPSAWRWARMGDVAQVIGGGTPRTEREEYFGGDVPWITPADLSGYTQKTISRGVRNITQLGLAQSGARLMPAGSVLFSSRAPIGYVAIAINPVATNQGFKSFVLSSELMPDYVYYWLQVAKKFAVAMASGTTFLEISGKKTAELPIPIPPIPTQRRIVAELEAQLTRLDASAAALKRAQANLKRYRTSVLKAACEGRLVPSEEGAMSLERNPSGLPAGWRWTTVGELAEVGTGATPKRGRGGYYGGTIPWITSGAVRDLFVQEATEFVTKKALAETNLTVYPPGTLLVAMYGEGKTRGMCAELVISAATNQALAAIQTDPGVKPYLKIFLLMNYENTRRAASGGVQPNLNLSLIRSIRVPLPPIQEQRRIVVEVERRLSIVDELDATAETNLARADRLRQSILAKAFAA